MCFSCHVGHVRGSAQPFKGPQYLGLWCIACFVATLSSHLGSYIQVIQGPEWLLTAKALPSQ